MHGHVPCFFQQRLWYKKNLEVVPSLASQKEWKHCLPFLVRPWLSRDAAARHCPASVKTQCAPEASLEWWYLVRTVKKYLVHKVCSFTRKRPRTAVIVAGNPFADLPHFVSGLSCTGKNTLLVRSKFRRAALCQCSHICKTSFNRDKGWVCKRKRHQDLVLNSK